VNLLTGVPLNPLLFTDQLIAELMQSMNAVPRMLRVRIYNEVVSSIAAGHPLRWFASLGALLPAGVHELVEGLYKDMCSIDYRERVADFATIFSRLNRATIILRNEAAYRVWRKQREIYRNNAEARRLRRAAAGNGKISQVNQPIAVMKTPVLPSSSQLQKSRLPNITMITPALDTRELRPRN